MSIRAALLAAAKVVGFALALPMPLVLVRTLDQTEFGLYKQVFQILQTSLTLLGLHVGLRGVGQGTQAERNGVGELGLEQRAVERQPELSEPAAQVKK